MIIREESPAEYPLIYDFVREAFKTARVSNGEEQDFVRKLQTSDRYIPSLSLVAVENGRIIGHVMLSKIQIKSKERPFESLLLAPLSVAGTHRNQGVGSSLVKTAFETAKWMGYTSVLIVGNPAYYSRFGFRSAKSFGITSAESLPENVFMACELVPDSLKGVSGTVDLSFE